MGASKSKRGQLAAAEGLVRFQLQANSSNTPFGSGVLHVHWVCVGVARACLGPLHPGPFSSGSHRPQFQDARGEARKPKGG